MSPTLRLVFPHQLFEEHLRAPKNTTFVLVEHDLLFRQFAFHAHKLVLHRASMRRFAGRLCAAGFTVEIVASDPNRATPDRLTELVRRVGPTRVEFFDPVDDWLARDTTEALADAGYRLRSTDVLETPGFLTDRADFINWFDEHPARMQHFYSWQRRRLGVLLDAGEPRGGRWSFDTENRKKLPRGHVPPPVHLFTEHTADVRAAIDDVARDFPDAPGDPTSFAWPTSHEEARAHLEQFLQERLALFGPYEDALAQHHSYLYHSLLTPMLNIGLLTPQEVLDATLSHAAAADVPLASLEGFIRQVIGWREYMRATYHLYGRRLRTSNRLGHTRRLDDSWWTATTGLDPVDLVIGRVLSTGYAHHIERLMVLGNALCLLRVHPTEVYAWFMTCFIDAYDWVMVPNVYAMSQFAAGDAMTTKPYISGSNYLRKMSDFPAGAWTQDWDALYWTFVHDHRQSFEGNPRTRTMTRMWDGFDPSRRELHLVRARPWLTDKKS